MFRRIDSSTILSLCSPDNSSAIVRSNLIKEISSRNCQSTQGGRLGSQHVGTQRKGNGPVFQGPILFPVRPSAFGADDQQGSGGRTLEVSQRLAEAQPDLAIKLLFSLSETIPRT